MFKLMNRFGQCRLVPALMNSIRIKLPLALESKRVMKQGKMIGYFISDQQSDYYQSKRFIKSCSCAKNAICKMKKNKLTGCDCY
jgi:transcription-repair coupling factor (superfamily II helicase)